MWSESVTTWLYHDHRHAKSHTQVRSIFSPCENLVKMSSINPLLKEQPCRLSCRLRRRKWLNWQLNHESGTEISNFATSHWFMNSCRAAASGGKQWCLLLHFTFAPPVAPYQCCIQKVLPFLVFTPCCKILTSRPELLFVNLYILCGKSTSL